MILTLRCSENRSLVFYEDAVLYYVRVLSSEQIQLKCIQTLSSIYQLADREVATPYIHSVGGPIIEHLLGAGGVNRPSTELQLAVTLEGVRMLETLVALAEDSTSKIKNSLQDYLV